MLSGTTVQMFPDRSNTSATNLSIMPSQTTTNNISFTLPTTPMSMSNTSTMSPLKNLQISAVPTLLSNSNHTSSSINFSPANNSPKKIMNPDTAIHYIDGYVIRESSQPFSYKEEVDQSDRGGACSKNDHPTALLQCAVCQTVNIASRFFDQTRLACSKICSITLMERALAEEKVLPNNFYSSIHNSTTENCNSTSTVSVTSPHHGLPTDPSKWTVND